MVFQNNNFAVETQQFSLWCVFVCVCVCCSWVKCLCQIYKILSAAYKCFYDKFMSQVKMQIIIVIFFFTINSKKFALFALITYKHCIGKQNIVLRMAFFRIQFGLSDPKCLGCAVSHRLHVLPQNILRD